MKVKLSSNKSLNEYLASLVRDGWSVSRVRRRNHLVLRHPAGGRPVFCAATPSDYRAIENIKRDVRGVLREMERGAI